MCLRSRINPFRDSKQKQILIVSLLLCPYLARSLSMLKSKIWWVYIWWSLYILCICLKLLIIKALKIMLREGKKTFNWEWTVVISGLKASEKEIFLGPLKSLCAILAKYLCFGNIFERSILFCSSILSFWFSKYKCLWLSVQFCVSPMCIVNQTY